ncbi:hypothetical protein BDV32DRAFT_119805 [Aspergillus pseudonomiae]|uniref:Uncharacterized protein n=1 Tax=Aspergillus pseudonomiae TaxID=1506151 RepID=A0A5N7DIU7_9EURO|nr:uncharacterized protein BDV37DRAFT_243375 [Aspergillus pseudonomiae]KAB8262970.1 hypothetical protein BDV32DRAFT_119805 [Aspergillus pseudonomiae]KAE8406185.1 hypothetical protein BDV37DRAFT_243375 [Aspergillus pseudonomiae]
MTRIPDRSAGPEQVRTYIRQTLTSKHKTEENFADEAARCWRLGRGSELHDATLEYLQKVFGVDIGLCLYNSVREDKEDAWEQSYIGFICNWTLYGSAAFLLWSLITYFLGHRPNLFLPLLLFGATLANYGYRRPTRHYSLLAMGIFNICISLLTIF